MKFNCGICKYKSDRSDNFKRHLLKHSNEKIACDCGKMMSAGALSRHKKNACKMRFKLKETNQARINDEVAVSNGLAHIQQFSSTKKIVRIDGFDVAVESTDGQISFQHEPIVIDGVKLTLGPSSIVMDANRDVNSNSTYQIKYSLNALITAQILIDLLIKIDILKFLFRW